MKIPKTLPTAKISDGILSKLRSKYRVGLPEEHPPTFEYSANIPKKSEKNILSELEKDGVIRNLNFHEDRNSYDFVATDEKLKKYHDKIREILEKKDKYFSQTEDKNLELADFEAMVAVGEDIAREIGAKNTNKCFVWLYYPQKDPAEITFTTVETEPVKRDISSGYVYKPAEPVIHNIYYDAKLFKEKGLELLKLRGVVKDYSIIPGDDMSKYKANVEIPGKKVFLQELESLKKKYEKRKEEDFSGILRSQIPQIAKKQTIIPFSTPLNTSWKQVSIRFISNDAAKIKVGDVTRKVTFAEMGFKDARKGDRPDSLWGFLKKGFGKHNGEISWETEIPIQEKLRVKKNVQLIRERLKAYFGIAEDPFESYKKVGAYRAKFKIGDDSQGEGDTEPLADDKYSFEKQANRYENGPKVRKDKFYKDRPNSPSEINE